MSPPPPKGNTTPRLRIGLGHAHLCQAKGEVVYSRVLVNVRKPVANACRESLQGVVLGHLAVETLSKLHSRQQCVVPTDKERPQNQPEYPETNNPVVQNEEKEPQ